tara:strand:- start:403 stop:639 length:237 start_codon:yes stop_codon:yes gene_type:complete
MRECAKSLIKYNVDCPCKDCRLWIDFEEDLNCTLIAIDKNKCLTLREVADRIGTSYVRVKQIQDAAHGKMLKRLKSIL